MFLAVTYHYIGEEKNYPFPGIYPTPLDVLERQLSILGSYFSFVSQADILESLAGRRKLPDRSCLVTFDDGLREQYEQALPVLEKNKIPAIFFVNGLPYDKGKALPVHKIHWCRAHLAPPVFFKKLAENYESLTGERFDISKFKISEAELQNRYQYDAPEAARLKFILNSNLIKAEVREKIIDAIFFELVPDEPAFCRSFYLTAEQIKHLHALGYLGIHTYSHKPLGLYPREICEKEIGECLRALRAVIGDSGANILSVSYPYGSRETIPSYIADLGKQYGLALGFTMERSFNQTLGNPFLLSRLNTNDVSGGKTPYFEIKNGEITVLNSKLTWARREHFQEP